MYKEACRPINGGQPPIKIYNTNDVLKAVITQYDFTGLDAV